MIKPPKVAMDALVNVLSQAPPEPIMCWLDSACPTSELHSAYRTRPYRWSTVFLLVLSIVVITALSGVGASLLFNDGIQVHSEKLDADDPISDVRLQEFLQVHRRRS
jgi:hypothetical protein